MNGNKTSSIDIEDRGLLYGDGLFETIAVLDGAPQYFDKHLHRLEKGCQRLGIPSPDPMLLQQEAFRLSEGNDRAVLKIIITRGKGGRGYNPSARSEPSRILSLYDWPEYPSGNAEKGVCVRYCETRLSENLALAGIKHLNRLEQVLARAEWDDSAIAEGLMLNSSGYVIEGTMSNLFIFQKGVLMTPDLSACGVEGVMRSIVLEAASRQGIDCQTCKLSQQDLARADEIFITNSLIGIWPVRQIDQQQYPVGDATMRLIKTIQ